MHWGVRQVHSRTDYIMKTDSRLFHTVAFRDVHNKIDQHLVLGYLRGADPAAHLRYLGKHTKFPIRPPDTPDKADRMFSEIWREIPKPLRRECHCQAWISPDTWSLIDTRMEKRRRRYQHSSRALARAIKSALQGDQQIQADKAGSDVEYLLP